ncbi:MAG: DUF4236 domain-containing protein [Clostridia bacterium]|nr:DUF4236 domain-containing protein [Clostridia bacterium]MBO6244462.1 DUF4236 domain-containing protein [Clostridia bacterium]
MGFSFFKRIKIFKDTYLNISKSGVSVSKKMGPVTVNTKGKASVNLGNGLRYQTSAKQIKKKLENKK